MEDLLKLGKNKIYVSKVEDYLKPQKFQSKILLVTSKGFKKRKVVDDFYRILGKEKIILLDEITPNPELNKIQEWIIKLQNESIKNIIALGGGSVIDTAKVLSALINKKNSNSLLDLILNNLSISEEGIIPLLVIPTTAGSGAEVTPFATIWDSENNKKFSLSSETLVPKKVILDYSLTVNLPIETTIYSGLDTISHCLESIWNKNADIETINIASEALKVSLRNLSLIVENPYNHNARKSMQISSCLAGIAISKTKTALAHSISYPFTTNFNMPHGLACSFTLPEILTFNSKEDDGRLKDVSNKIGFEDINLLKNHLIDIFENKFNISTKLKKYLPNSFNEIEPLMDKMSTPSRIKNNIRFAERKDIFHILEKSLLDIYKL